MQYILTSNVMMVLKLYRISANLIIHFKRFCKKVHFIREKAEK
jgi:hypothetical protein